MNAITVTAEDRSRHILTVDAARGLFAIGVMVYHLLRWERIAAIYQLGFYCVYAFFVISGFALYVTYSERLGSTKAIRSYAVRRYRRISPLFYLSIALSVWLNGAPDDFLHKLALNAALVFGLANPGQTSLVTGGWSIGIEMVFYLALPLIVAASGKSLLRLSVLTIIALAVSSSFINLTLGDGKMRWIIYTQPIAFFIYFVAGCLIGELYMRNPHLKGGWPAVALVVIALLPFMLLQEETVADLLIGWTGLILTTSTILLVAGVAFMPEPRGAVQIMASWVGRISYPVYLLHPIAYGIVGRYTGLDGIWHIAAAIIATIILADIVNRQLEQRVARLGRATG